MEVLDTVVVKDGCWIEVPIGAFGQVGAIYSTFIHFEIFQVQNLVGLSRCSSRLCCRCGAVRLFGLGARSTFRDAACSDFVAGAVNRFFKSEISSENCVLAS